MLATADSRFAATGIPGNQMAVASLDRRYWPHRPNFVIPIATAPVPPLAVQAANGRWVVQCPGCKSAQLASRTDPRFFCAECGNPGVGGQWVAIAWPDTATQADIEAVLAPRPVFARSWLPTETVADLVAENDAHGVEVPAHLRARYPYIPPPEPILPPPGVLTPPDAA